MRPCISLYTGQHPTHTHTHRSYLPPSSRSLRSFKSPGPPQAASADPPFRDHLTDLWEGSASIVWRLWNISSFIIPTLAFSLLGNLWEENASIDWSRLWNIPLSHIYNWLFLLLFHFSRVYEFRSFQLRWSLAECRAVTLHYWVHTLCVLASAARVYELARARVCARAPQAWCCSTENLQSWALSVLFFNFFNNKKWFFAFFIKLIWLGVGFYYPF